MSLILFSNTAHPFTTQNYIPHELANFKVPLRGDRSFLSQDPWKEVLMRIRNIFNDQSIVTGNIFSRKNLSYRSILSGTYSTTKKVVATTMISLITYIPIALVTGHTGDLFEELGVINSNTSKWLNGPGFDLGIQNPKIRLIAEIIRQYFAEPVVSLREFLWNYTPDVLVGGQNISKLFVATTLEELQCRGLIQRVALPMLSKALPKPVSNILNHKFTRIFLTSAIFALAHDERDLDHPFGVYPQFLGGIVYGAAAELDNSLVVPILAHFLDDFMIGYIKRRPLIT